MPGSHVSKTAGPARPRILLRAQSERKLQGHLSNPAIPGAINLAKATVDFADRIGELSVIKHIEELGAKLKSSPFADTGVLLQGEIPIVDSWSEGSVYLV